MSKNHVPLESTSVEQRIMTSLLRTAGQQIMGGKMYEVNEKMGLDPKREKKVSESVSECMRE